MKNVCLQKWDNGRPGSGYGEVRTVPDDFRPEDVTGDYDELEIIESGRVVYRKVKGTVVYDEREKGDRDMSKRTFKDLVDEAKEQLDIEKIRETYGNSTRYFYSKIYDKKARGLQAKIDDITETYLENVPESFESLEMLECYFQELREVIDETKAEIDTVREYCRNNWMTEYSRAIIREADDVVKDLIFERSAAERAYDIVSAMLTHPEEDAEKDELDLFLDMFFKNDPDGADKLREAADRLEAKYEKVKS